MSWHIKYILFIISQAILGSILFDFWWMMPDTFIIPLLDVCFCPSDFFSSLFTCSIILQAYFIGYFELISSTIFRLPMQWSTCCRSFASIIASFGSSCVTYTYNIDTMYASLSLRSLAGLPNTFLIVVETITSITIFLVTLPTDKRSHRCSREENFSCGKNKLRVLQKLVFDTPNSSRISV